MAAAANILARCGSAAAGVELPSPESRSEAVGLSRTRINTAAARPTSFARVARKPRTSSRKAAINVQDHSNPHSADMTITGLEWVRMVVPRYLKEGFGSAKSGCP
ncbi:unnamed protein product [Prorocentrum cordatum]|uniref:Uncharacterized protein n=1 Tax=Prorocentrum cordatum TaxID=2364126 RepID=A0ABN9TFE7_9DINO|nr:unnamed protein product [Polarella glacialis]